MKRIILALILIVLLASLFLLRKSALERRLEGKERLSFLIIGLEGVEEPQSLKDILLINYQPNTKRIALVIIPPQTLVTESMKLSTLYRQKGYLLVKETLEGLLDLEIPFYVVLDDQDIVRIINLLGGIEVEINQPLPYGNGFLEGKRRLSGKECLAYLEFEEPRFGEFGKFSRWQRFIWTLIQRFGDFSPDSKLARELLKSSLLTNLKVKDILALAQEAENIREAGIEVEKIPGRTIYRDWMSYWQVDTLATSQLFKELSRELGKGEGIIRVEVLNGCGRGGIAFQVAQDLRREGLDVVNIGNARNFKYRKTLILNRSGKKGLAREVARVVGCGEPQDRIEKKALVDVTVIIGRDYLRIE